jgi:hypothetical protein
MENITQKAFPRATQENKKPPLVVLAAQEQTNL